MAVVKVKDNAKYLYIGDWQTIVLNRTQGDALTYHFQEKAKHIKLKSKVLILGPGAAGKTRLIKSMSSSMSVNQQVMYIPHIEMSFIQLNSPAGYLFKINSIIDNILLNIYNGYIHTSDIPKNSSEISRYLSEVSKRQEENRTTIELNISQIEKRLENISFHNGGIDSAKILKFSISKMSTIDKSLPLKYNKAREVFRLQNLDGIDNFKDIKYNIGYHHVLDDIIQRLNFDIYKGGKESIEKFITQMESSLSEGGIQYKIKLSLSNGSNDLYYFKLHDKKTRKDISLNEASDTEKALLMAGALRWYFNGAEKMDMLLLDEPDSHIDPARISVFIDIIGSVTNHLAISSHSLTTIDLFSNDDNWDLVSVEKKSEDNFELSRITGNDIELAKHRYRVCGNKSYINTDSESYISALLRSRFKDIIVFVEGKTDKIYLNKAIEYLKINNKDFNNNIEVVSYSSASIPEKLPEGNSIENNGGASQVANVCQFAIKSDFYNTNKNNIQKIFFLFDNDPAGIYEDERSTKGLKSENKKLEKYKEWKYKKIESHGIYIARLPRYNIIKEEFYSIEAFRNGPINNKTKVAEKYKINNSEDSFCRIILDIQSIVSI